MDLAPEPGGESRVSEFEQRYRPLLRYEGGVQTAPACLSRFSSFGGVSLTILASMDAPTRQTAASIFLAEPRAGFLIIIPYLPMNATALRRCAFSCGCPSQVIRWLSKSSRTRTTASLNSVLLRGVAMSNSVLETRSPDAFAQCRVSNRSPKSRCQESSIASQYRLPSSSSFACDGSPQAATTLKVSIASRNLPSTCSRGASQVLPRSPFGFSQTPTVKQ